MVTAGFFTSYPRSTILHPSRRAGWGWLRRFVFGQRENSFRFALTVAGLFPVSRAMSRFRIDQSMRDQSNAFGLGCMVSGARRRRTWLTVVWVTPISFAMSLVGRSQLTLPQRWCFRFSAPCSTEIETGCRPPQWGQITDKWISFMFRSLLGPESTRKATSLSSARLASSGLSLRVRSGFLPAPVWLRRSVLVGGLFWLVAGSFCERSRDFLFGHFGLFAVGAKHGLVISDAAFRGIIGVSPVGGFDGVFVDDGGVCRVHFLSFFFRRSGLPPEGVGGLSLPTRRISPDSFFVSTIILIIFTPRFGGFQRTPVSSHERH